MLSPAIRSIVGPLVAMNSAGSPTETVPSVSVVIPLFNSADLLRNCHLRLRTVLDGLERAIEVVYVDDGSRDQTLTIAKEIQSEDPRVRIVELADNYGQHAAIFAGLEQSRGKFLVTLDVDLQCDPAGIPRILASLEEGHDLVCGVRRGRGDPRFRQFISWTVTKAAEQVARRPIRDAGCPLNGLTRELAKSISHSGEARRFPKPLAMRLAGNLSEIEVAHSPRPRGHSSYTANALIRLFMDVVVNTTTHIFGWLFVVSGALTALLVFLTIVLGAGALVGIGSFKPALILASTCAASTLVLLLSLIGEYAQRTHRHASGAPFYAIRKVHEPGSSPCL
ncbi:MAG: undecaprenyl-phosphate 4-deoxy-4-formamido-L-arabinose transferase [Variibacter sp.]|nr:undecaprenyl-phosphate 4-deoxy-4-formamido-L-arabinose transferase [Variibacter sp.]